MAFSKGKSRIFIALGIAATILILIFLCRIYIFQTLGQFLSYSNPPKHPVCTFMLSGNPVERGNEIKILVDSGLCSKVFVTGGNYSPDILAAGFNFKESHLSYTYLLSKNIDKSIIDSLPQGTSTLEELQLIKDYCMSNSVSEINIVSSMFHTRRIHKTAKRVFSDTGIQICITGAKAISYDEQNWWKSENGLLALNNEYVKLVYYTLKYGF